MGVIIAVSIRPKGAPPGRPADGCWVPVMTETLLRRPRGGTPATQPGSEHRDDVLGVDVVRHVHPVDVQLGDGREGDAPAGHDRPHPGHRHPPVLGLLLVGQHAEAGVAGVPHEHPVVGQEIRGQFPEPLRRLPQDHREEHEPRPELAGDQDLDLLGQARPLVLQDRHADLQVPGLVPADPAEHRREHGVGGARRHATEQGGRGHLAHHEAGEQDRQRVLADRLVVAGPVPAAVVVEPGDVVVRGLLQGRRRRPVQRAARPEPGDGALAALLVVHLVPGDREEALADRVLLVLLERVDRGAGEYRRAGGVEVGQHREPVHDAEPLLGGEVLPPQPVPRQVGRVPDGELGFLVDRRQLGGLHPPLHRVDVRLRDGGRRPEPALRDYQVVLGVCHVGAPSRVSPARKARSYYRLRPAVRHVVTGRTDDGLSRLYHPLRHDAASPGRLVVVTGSGQAYPVRAVPACPGWFVGGGWCAGCMPRRRCPRSPKVVHRTARAGLRVTRRQRRRRLGLLASGGDVWAAVLELNAWRRARQDRPRVAYQGLCRELAASGPGTFGELDTVGARSVLRRYSDAWFAAAQRRRGGDQRARFPRRRRALVPLRWYHGTFTLAGRRLGIPVARGCPALWVRLDRDLPYPPEQVRSVTLLYDAGRPWVDVTAEVPVACYSAGQEPDPARVAGVDLGIIHPYAVAGPGGEGLLVSGRAVRAEHRMHLADRK